jgi:hypothetical protein
LELSHSFARECARLSSQVDKALQTDAVPDAHQILRRAAQELLVANLISRGWIIRGSKKRPEIAKAYNLHESAPDFMKLFLDINGLTNLTPDTAASLCAERHELRQSVAENLRALSVGLTEEPSNTITVSTIEHKCTLAAADAAAERYGLICERFEVDRDGRFDLDDLAAKLADDVLCVAAMAVNYEIGTVQDRSACWSRRCRAFARAPQYVSRRASYSMLRPFCASVCGRAKSD